jgi:lipopolysaccharide biosynthesis regulator YciM
LNDALAIKGESPEPNLIMGRLLAQEGKVNQAINHYEIALRSRPRLQPEVSKTIDKLRKHQLPPSK